jgi:hypothetical protein
MGISENISLQSFIGEEFMKWPVFDVPKRNSLQHANEDNR